MNGTQLRHREHDGSQPRSQQDCDNAEQPSSVQDPGVPAQLKQEQHRHGRRRGGQGLVQQSEGSIGEIDKHVSDGFKKLLIENKCDLSTTEAKEFPNLKLRDWCHE